MFNFLSLLQPPVSIQLSSTSLTARARVRLPLEEWTNAQEHVRHIPQEFLSRLLHRLQVRQIKLEEDRLSSGQLF